MLSIMCAYACICSTHQRNCVLGLCWGAGSAARAVRRAYMILCHPLGCLLEAVGVFMAYGKGLPGNGEVPGGVPPGGGLGCKSSILRYLTF